MSGFVSFTGKSSLHVSIHVEELFSNESPLLTAKFTMVARNGQSVNPLRLETDIQKELFKMGAGQHLIVYTFYPYRSQILETISTRHLSFQKPSFCR
jgi:hypothetical protein